MTDRAQAKGSSAANLRVAALAGGIALSMVGLAYASVPLYRMFCQLTGYGGSTRIAQDAPQKSVGRTVTVRFDANVAQGLDWDFRPMQREVSVRLGEKAQIWYEATNRSDREIAGTAVFNVTPHQTGAYFNKIECFCFAETVLKPGQRIEMPVVFFVDPEMIDNEEAGGIDTITLSYTFFASPTPVASAPAPKVAGNGG
jgi:cytochrome c oxidase assembly protein subunit 11